MSYRIRLYTRVMILAVVLVILTFWMGSGDLTGFRVR